MLPTHAPKGLKASRYNADAGFTLQHHVTLAAVTADDDKETATAKVGVVADFLDSWLNLRLWNYKSNSYSSMQYAIFLVIGSIRGKSLAEVRTILHKRLLNEMEEIELFRTGRSQPVHFKGYPPPACPLHRLVGAANGRARASTKTT